MARKGRTYTKAQVIKPKVVTTTTPPTTTPIVSVGMVGIRGAA